MHPFDLPTHGRQRRRTFAAVVTLAVAASVVAGAVRAADAPWPQRPITLVNPYAAGGPADSLARSLARQLETRLGATVIVDNKAGGAATIGTGFVARAKPDGYTLLISTSAGHVVTPLMQKVPYDGIEDFDFIGVVANQPNVLAASPALGVKSVAELVTLARRQPGTLNYASAGMGGATHLGGVTFQQRAGVEITHVPYAGAAPAIKDVLGGQVQLAMLNLGAVLPFVRDGKLVALAYAGSKRSELIPDVPTMAEAGVRNAESSTWYTLSAPRGTPPAIIARIASALDATLADPAFAQFLTSQGAERIVMSPGQTRQFVIEDRRNMTMLLRSIGQLAR